MAASKMWDVPGGYDVILVSVMPKKYKCPFCKLLMKEPIQTYRGEMACESCYINASKSSNNICPIDGEEVEMQNGDTCFKDRHVGGEILQLQCYCPNKKSGCDWQTVVNEIGKHCTNCLYKEMSCTQCHDIILRKDVGEHETMVCRFRITSCSYCTGPYDAQSLQEHEATCHMKPMECPYKCGESTMVNTLYNHLENCHMVLTGNICPYQIVGCHYQPRDSADLSDHMQISGKTHAAFAVSLVTTLQRTNEKIRHDLLSEQQVRAELAKRVEEQKENYTVLETQVQKIKDKLYSIQQENTNMQEKCEASEVKIKEDIREIDLRMEQDSLYNIERSLTEMKMKYDEFDAKINSGAIGRSSSGSSNSEEFRQVGEKVNQLERGSAVLTANLSDLELKLQLFENTSYDGRQLWKVDNVMYRMNQAVTGKVTALHSAPCFQRMGGYKFCSRYFIYV